jgi:hypothetical protein
MSAGNGLRRSLSALIKGESIMSVIFSTVASQEDNSAQFQPLDQVLHNAELRRTADLGGWLRQYLEERRQTRRQKRLVLPPAAITRSATG